jgi:hypothetical protein
VIEKAKAWQKRCFTWEKNQNPQLKIKKCKKYLLYAFVQFYHVDYFWRKNGGQRMR